MAGDEKYFVVHGHFYQPPRENPYLGRIDRQDSAAPEHDWNEKIAGQCYAPNGRSRILNHQGEIDDIVNNYAFLNHNFGPTLMSWLAREQPLEYRRILEGDRLARNREGSSGTAMAQVYNHVIMPLADDLDRVTQIRWGLKDFEHRYGRRARGIWLAETALHHRTVDTLIEEGIEYTVLSPTQAEEIAPLTGGPWESVADGSIDIHRPYRIHHGRGTRNRRFLTAFFYHSELARGIAFGDLLKSADLFAQKVRESLDGSGSRFTLVATDGESFGHHKPFGDMCLAAMFYRKLPEMGIRVASLEYLLEHMKATSEVRLKAGDQGLGTAWSCAHGVGRWLRDCGCHTGGGPGWNQAWREPLYQGVKDLQHRLKTLYFEEASAWFLDPWDARNRYIDVLIHDHDQQAQERFFEDVLRRPASAGERHRLLRLLESQKYAMFAMTSCAWFFSDISGIETVQNLRYAARAIELAGPGSAGLHDRFRRYLREARSNIAEHRDGAHIYDKWVMAHALTPAKLLSRELLSRMAHSDEGLRAPAVNHRLVEIEAGSFDHSGPTRGVAELVDRTTRGEERFLFAFTPAATVGATCSLWPEPPGAAPPDAPGDGSGGDDPSGVDPTRVGSSAGGGPAGGRPGDPATSTPVQPPVRVGWTELDTDLKDQLMAEGLEGESRAIGQTLNRALRDWEPVLAMAAETGAHLPHRIWESVRMALEWEIESRIDDEGAFPPVELERISAVLGRARDLKVQLHSRSTDRALTRTVERLLDELARTLDATPDDPPARKRLLQRLQEVLVMEETDGVQLRRADLENRVWLLVTEGVRRWVDSRTGFGDTDREWLQTFKRLARRFNFSTRCLETRLPVPAPAPPGPPGPPPPHRPAA